MFCDVQQISEGPQRWQRYFTARRRVEARMDTGKPLRDYRVRGGGVYRVREGEGAEGGRGLQSEGRRGGGEGSTE